MIEIRCTDQLVTIKEEQIQCILHTNMKHFALIDFLLLQQGISQNKIFNLYTFCQFV